MSAPDPLAWLRELGKDAVHECVKTRGLVGCIVADEAAQVLADCAPALARALIASYEALVALLEYTGAVEARYSVFVASRPSMCSFPENAQEVGDQARAAIQQAKELTAMSTARLAQAEQRAQEAEALAAMFEGSYSAYRIKADAERERRERAEAAGRLRTALLEAVWAAEGDGNVAWLRTARQTLRDTTPSGSS